MIACTKHVTVITFRPQSRASWVGRVHARRSHSHHRIADDDPGLRHLGRPWNVGCACHGHLDRGAHARILPLHPMLAVAT